MATYGYGQLEQLWQQAGGSDRLAPVMAAIALAESGGRTGATHKDANGSTDYGLWQINSIHGYNAGQLLSNPLYNAKAAVSIEKGSGLGAWSTYNNGAYKKYLSGGAGSGTGLPYNPNDSQVGRIDEGVDITSSSPFIAVAPGRVVHIDPNFYNGTPSVYIKLDQPVTVNGTTYKGVYYAETRALVKVGQHVDAGQNVIGPGNAEIGFASQFGSSAGSWLPSAHNTYHEGSPTQAGSDFAATIKVAGGSSFWGNLANDLGFGTAKGVVSGVSGAAGGALSGAEAVGSFLEKITQPAFWLRVVEVLGGGIIALLGIYLLTKQIGLAAAEATPQPIVDLAAAVPQTRAAGAVLEGTRERAQSRRNEREYRQGQREGQARASRSEGRKAGSASIASAGVTKGRTRRVELSESSSRKAATRRRAARAEPSNEIPF